jgi:hypothetical protein
LDKERCTVSTLTPEEIDPVIEGNLKNIPNDDEEDAENREDMLTMNRFKYCAVDTLLLKYLKVY